MRTVTTKKTLRLGRETLRVLSNAQLAHVAGGATQNCNDEDPEINTRTPGPSGKMELGCVGHRPHLADK